MSSRDSITVFVDALPFEERQRLTSVRDFLRWNRPIQPGFGYSINVKAELFAGLRPDDVGFLNEWGYEPGKGYSWGRQLARFDKVLSSNRLLRRGVNKVVSRIVGESLRNIPFPLLGSVFRTGITAYERKFSEPTVFSENDVRRYLYSEHNGDRGAFESLCGDLERSTEPFAAFLAMAGLDYVMHSDGKHTPAYDQEILETDRRLRRLWELLAARGHDPRLLILSDHGMAQVDREVPFKIEESIGGLGESYGYFVDATMVRIWTQSDSVQQEVESWIEESDIPGVILDTASREQWGIRSKQFGDIIFLLDEGAMFVPNFFSDFGCSAMHGYLPSLESQRGLIASSLALDSTPGELPLAAVEAYSYLQRFCEEPVSF